MNEVLKTPVPRYKYTDWLFSGRMSFWDVSIDRGEFDSSGQRDFTAYLASKGLPLENVRDRYGKWMYCGVIENSDQYRVQYYEVEDQD